MATCKREMVSLPYTQAQLRALWAVAATRDIMQGGRWDARVASLNCWSRPFAPSRADELPVLLVTLYFSWGGTPRLWAVERLLQLPEETPWCVLGDLERATFGAPIHGMVREEGCTK